MAKGKVRQRKKNERKKLLQQAATLNLPKAEKLTFEDLTQSIAQAAAAFEAERKREDKNRRERERRAANRELIDRYGLTGFKPSDGTAKIQAAAEAAQKAIDRAAARALRQVNEALLTNSGIARENWPKGWTKNEDIQSWIEKYQAGELAADNSKIFDSPVWLYIGWGDKSGSTDAHQWFNSAGWYGSLTVRELRDGIATTAKSDGGDTSSGRAGDTAISYGTYEEVRAYMEYHEKSGYQTVFFGNQISNHALMRYTAAAMDSSPESNRPFIIGQINGYLSASGNSKYKIKV